MCKNVKKTKTLYNLQKALRTISWDPFKKWQETGFLEANTLGQAEISNIISSFQASCV